MCILCINYGTNLAYLKPPDSVQRPRVSRYGFMTLLCIIWNSCGVLHDLVSEMILMATPYVKYHKFTEVGRNYFSHYDKTSENCGSVRVEENARMHMTNQRKTTFLHKIITLVATHQHGYKRYAFISFSTKLPSWKMLYDIEGVKICLCFCFA